jgi:hypothetical protein
MSTTTRIPARVTGRGRIMALAFLVVFGAALLALAGRSAVTTLTDAFPGGVIVTEAYLLVGQHEGDLAIAAGSARTTQAARVVGNTALLAESVSISGTFDGSLTVLSSYIAIDGATVKGQLVLVGDNIVVTDSRIEGEALIDGRNLNLTETAVFATPPTVCSTMLMDTRRDAALEPCPPSGIDPFETVQALRQASLNAMPLVAAGITVLSVGLICALLAVITAFMPARIVAIGGVMRRYSVRALLVGAAVISGFVGLSGAVIVLLGTLPPLGWVLIVIWLLLGLALFILILIGLAALAHALGSVILARFARRAETPITAVVTGGVIVALALVLIAVLPVHDLIVLTLLILLTAPGAGAAFGARTDRSSA